MTARKAKNVQRKSIPDRLHGCLRSPPAEWRADFHQHNAFALFVILILFGLAGFTRLALGNGLETEISKLGLACGALGTVGVGFVGIANTKMHSQTWHFQTTTFLLASGANLLICTCIGSFEDAEVRQVGLVGSSLIAKFTVAMFGWSPLLSLAWVGNTLLSYSVSQIWAFPMDEKPGTLGYIATDAFFAAVAVLSALSYNHVLQQLYSVNKAAEGDTTAFRQVMRLTCDGEIWISLDESDKLIIKKADHQFADLVGRQVENECLEEFMADPDEYAHVKDSFRGTTITAPLLRPTTLRDGHGQPLQVELLVVRWHGDLKDRGTSTDEFGSDMNSVYLVGVRQFVSTVTFPGADSATFQHNRFSPADSIGSVLPHIIHQGSEGSANYPGTPASSSVTKSNGTSEVFNMLDLSNIVRLGVKEHWLIEPEELELVPDSVLGKGGFGIVVEAKYYGAPLAAKITKRTCSTTLGDARNTTGLIHELRMLRRARHPNIVPFYGASVEVVSREIVLLFEKINAPTLGIFVTEAHGQIERGKNVSTAHQKLAKTMVDLGRALRYLHARSPAMVHGDLKPANVFVTGDKDCQVNAMLADFGLSRRISSSARPMGFTRRWAAPEIMTNVLSPSTVADIFSFGRVMSFIITGLAPMHCLTEVNIDQIMKSGKLLPAQSWPDGTLSLACSQLADGCLMQDPSARPSIQELSPHLEMVPQDLIALERGNSLAVQRAAQGISDRAAASQADMSSILPGSAPESGSISQTQKVDSNPESFVRESWVQAIEQARAYALRGEDLY